MPNALLILVMALLLLTSCVPAATPVATSPRQSTASPFTPVATGDSGVGQAKYGGVLTRAIPEDAANLDVHQAASVNVQLSLANVYNGLLRLDPFEVNKVVPDLGEKWAVTADGKTYTFSLRKGVMWHDGKPFTSDDAKFNLERMAFWKEHKIVSPRGGQMLSALEKVETLGPSTVEVTLKYPSSSFLDNLAAGWVLMLPKHVIQAKGDMKKEAVGTGAFRWKAWNPGISQELVRNPDYFVKGLPYLDGIRVYVIKDDATRFAAFSTGQVKMPGTSSSGLSNFQADRVRKEMADRAVAIPHTAAVTRYLLFMNYKRKPWNDLRVRQAVDLAYDRKAAIAINWNVGILGAAMHPKGAWGIPEQEMAKRPGYRQPKDADLAKAKSLLAEAGYPQGFTTTIISRGIVGTEQIAVVTRDQLAKVGIGATVQLVDSAGGNDRLSRHDFDLASWLPQDALDEPDTVFSGYYITGGSRNYGEFNDKQIDDLFNKQAAMLDVKERKKVVLEMQQRILDLVIYPVILWDLNYVGFWKEVRGYVVGPGPYSHNNLDHVWLAK